MKRENLTVWTVGEIAEDIEYQETTKALVELDDVNVLLDELSDKVIQALSKIKDIQGIDLIAECEKELIEVLKMLH